MDNELNNILINSSSKVIEEIAPKVYEDGLHDTVKLTGDVISLVPRTIRAALTPLKKWILSKEYNLKETEKLLEIKLQNISPDKITTPEPYIAVPALQAISYCMDNVELRNIYANLLAKAMNTDTAKDVHPAFTEIIKQLSPLEALILKTKEVNAMPLCELRVQNISYPYEMPVYFEHLSDFRTLKQGTTLYKNLSLFSFDGFTENNVSTALENLERLGLIEMESTALINKDYSPFRQLKVYINLKNQVEENKVLAELSSNHLEPKAKKFMDNCEFAVIPQSAYTTTLGKVFIKICVE